MCYARLTLSLKSVSVRGAVCFRTFRKSPSSLNTIEPERLHVDTRAVCQSVPSVPHGSALSDLLAPAVGEGGAVGTVSALAAQCHAQCRHVPLMWPIRPGGTLPTPAPPGRDSPPPPTPHPGGRRKRARKQFYYLCCLVIIMYARSYGSFSWIDTSFGLMLIIDPPTISHDFLLPFGTSAGGGQQVFVRRRWVGREGGWCWPRRVQVRSSRQ